MNKDEIAYNGSEERYMAREKVKMTLKNGEELFGYSWTVEKPIANVVILTGMVCYLLRSPLPIVVSLLYVLASISKRPVSSFIRYFAPVGLVLSIPFLCL